MEDENKNVKDEMMDEMQIWRKKMKIWKKIWTVELTNEKEKKKSIWGQGMKMLRMNGKMNGKMNWNDAVVDDVEIEKAFWMILLPWKSLK